MVNLNFPGYQFYVRGIGRSREIFDPISQKYLVLTPEEWVRQHLIQYLVQEKDVPIGLLRREIPLKINGASLRADLVAYSREGKALIVGECKAPHIRLSQATLDQVGHYNRKLRAGHIIITNGLDHYAYRVDQDLGTTSSVEDVPIYKALCNYGYTG